MPKPEHGFIFYEGESLLDGSPIVGIATGLDIPSSNSKTGQVIQTYIIRSDIPPIEAIKSGNDQSICGNCPLRRGICYVNPLPIQSIYNKYRNGGYDYLSDRHLNSIKRRGKVLRFGAYGDPVAIHQHFWEPLAESAAAYVGYTHQWQGCPTWWQDYLMASVESRTLKWLANNMGWRTFRVINPDDELDSDEMLCTNTRDEYITCEICRLCNGGKGKNIADVVHGLDWKLENFRQLVGV